MRWAQQCGGIVLGLMLVAQPGRAVAPPRGPTRLDAEQQRQLAALGEQQGRAETAGRFEEALKTARQLLALREQWQGRRHADTLEARLIAEGLRQLVGVAAKDRAVVVRSGLLTTEGMQLHAQGRSRQAEEKFREALAIRRKVLGEKHPHTAGSYHDLAASLSGQGKHVQAQPLFEKALALRRKALGEEHINTAGTYNGLAFCLNAQGQHGRALPLFEKTLLIHRQAAGEDHPHTATSYNNVGYCLLGQGQYVRALPFFERALNIRRRVLGEEHHDTGTSCNNVGMCLNALGQHARALPWLDQALTIARKTRGEDHPLTGTAWSSVAVCLLDQGQHARALPLFERALAIKRAALGDEHPQVALACNNLATCLDALSRHAQALPLYEKALSISRKVLGAVHPQTALACNNVAACLSDLGRPNRALPFYRESLAIRQKAHGEEHPDTARGYNNVAYCLNSQGKHVQALPLFERALAIMRRTLGDEHPETASVANILSVCLDRQGRLPEAMRLLQRSLPGQEAARFHSGASGFDRAVASRFVSPHTLLALGLARLNQPRNAFAHAEAALARGLLDDLPRSDPGDARRLAALSGQLHLLDDVLVSQLVGDNLSGEQQRRREELVRRRRAVTGELSRLAAAVSARQLVSLSDIQAVLPADAALLFWSSYSEVGQYWGCVLRRQGAPAWARLPGSGKAGAWTADDRTLAARLYRALTDPDSTPEQHDRLLTALREQRLKPLLGHLAARGDLPAVRHLFVVPTGEMAYLPVEVLAPDRVVSAIPSGSVLARLLRQHRPLSGNNLLALGAPNFLPPDSKAPEPPARGLLLSAVLPGSAAARAGLQAGDVLLSFGTQPVEGLDDLKQALASGPGRVRYWRDGKLGRTPILPAGRLGVSVDVRPPREAVRYWRQLNTARSPAGAGHPALPGTAYEVKALAGLVRNSSVLLGSEASEQELDRLLNAGKLRGYRLLHFATHGAVSEQTPDRCRLILAQDRLPDPRQLPARQKGYTGELTVQTIRRTWELDADLVVLSACQTALGKSAAGDGLLGFAQVFLSRGARAVVLSRWKVDDSATALLMVRFYENLLGKRKGMKAMGRAQALQEAKAWLRALPREQAGKFVAGLTGGVLRGTEGGALPLVKGKPVMLPGGDRPFAHPYFWAAWMLVGDPD